MANVRGNFFIIINKWLTKKLSEDDYNELISTMRPPVVRVLSQGESWSWCPLEYLDEVYDGITAYMKETDAVLGELGKALAEGDIGSSPKTRLALIPIVRVMARIPYLWSRLKDSGDFKTLSVDEKAKQAVLALSGYDGGKRHCAVIRTWLEKMCELLSGMNVTVKERSCRWEQGGDACYWEIGWE